MILDHDSFLDDILIRVRVWSDLFEVSKKVKILTGKVNSGVL